MKRLFLRTGVMAGALLLCFAVSASAAVLMRDGFFYFPDGDLTVVSKGLWQPHSGGGNSPIQVVSNEAILQQGSGSREDDNRGFAARGASDVTYVALKVMVESGAISLGTGDYLAHFRNSGSFAYPARIYVAASQHASGDFTFGISGTSTGTTPIVYWGSDSNFDTYYTVVAKYDASNGDATLWVDPSGEGDTSITSSGGATGDLIDTYALRQGSSNTCTEHVDDIVVGETFADTQQIAAPGASPAGLLLLASLLLGAGTLFVVRRRSALA